MRHSVPRLLFVAVLALGVAACGKPSDDAIDVTVIGASMPALTDPASGPLSTPGKVLLSNTAQGLVRFDARGQIDSGLAERWNVSDDGLSYIFRLESADWPDGRPIVARDVARILNRQLKSGSRNELKDTLGAVDEIVAMTDRVIEVRLQAPRPFLLQLLAQPEFAIVRQGWGTGPFQRDRKQPDRGVIALTHTIRVVDDKDRVERVRLRSASAQSALESFKSGKANIVLGGTFDDLPLVSRDRETRGTLHFDPVAGLFGLAPARGSGPIADRQLRDVLNRAINRDALIASLNVPGLVPRTTLLQGGLESGANPKAPAWSSDPYPERYARASQEGRAAIGAGETLRLAIALPDGPGGQILFDRLKQDWTPLGIELVRAGRGIPADLKVIDEVAPSSSGAWFVRRFRCGVQPLCSSNADTLMDDARDTLVANERSTLLVEAAQILDEQVLFMPIAAPVRWSLASTDLPGFAENIFAIHPLSGLRDKPSRERQ